LARSQTAFQLAWRDRVEHEVRSAGQLRAGSSSSQPLTACQVLACRGGAAGAAAGAGCPAQTGQAGQAGQGCEEVEP
jgi:hypothetical protein